jgi:hypothetical protein
LPYNGNYVSPILPNTTPYTYYRVNVTAVQTLGNTPRISEIEMTESTDVAGGAAGGSFNFNSGSISGSVTSASPLGIGATNLITVTATTGSVGLTVGGDVLNTPSVAQVINHTGNCDFILSGTIFRGGTGTGTVCINKTSLGTIYITGSVRGLGSGNQFGDGLTSTAGNTVVLGDVIGGFGSNGAVYGIRQTFGNITVTGNVIGGASGATGNNGILSTGTSIRVIGNVIGGAVGIAINTTAPVIVIGDVTGSVANGITTTAPVIVSGSVVAQGAAAAITSTSAIFINVSGSVIASATANGISSTNASAVVNLAGNIVNVNGKQAIYCQNLFLDNTATTQARFFTFGGSDRTLYSSDTFPNLPSSSNVRFGTTYGPGSGNTGTLRMASPQDVRSGVLTDNTTGSAILSMESLSNEIQTSSDPFAQRLKNLTTVDIIGNLLTAFKK